MAQPAALAKSNPDSGIFPIVTDVAAWDDEASLLDRLLLDDGAAWREFNRRYSRLLLVCIARVTARFGYASTDDVQEIYAMFCLQLLANDKKKLRSFESARGIRLASWLGMLVTHTAYDFLRAVRRAPRLDDFSLAEACETELPDPSEATLLREQVEILSRALSALTEKDREFVELFYGAGLSAEEVACRMGINVKTVYTKKHKLQSKLQNLLKVEKLAA